MLVSEVLEYIRDCTATPDDLQNRTITPLFTNAKIIRQLKLAMDRYANYTKGIEDYNSQPVSANQSSIPLPSNIIRSEGVRFIVFHITGMAYPLNIINLNNGWGNYSVPVQGIPKSAMIWKDRIRFMPQNVTGYSSTTLSSTITSTDTTIETASSTGFPAKEGRITIDSEVIEYAYASSGIFYECRRGVEDTTAASHTNGTTVSENNLWIYYYRLNFEISVDDNDDISDADLAKELLIADDHLEIIIKYTVYNLLLQIDVQRAMQYKTDWEGWLKQARIEVYNGRSSITRSSNVRNPYQFELPTAYYRA